MTDTKISLSDEEVRVIAIFRAIKDFGNDQLISGDDVGVALSLLRIAVPELEKLETELKPAELKLFLRGFITGLGASKVSEVPYNQYDHYDGVPQFNGAEIGVEPR